MVKAKAPIGTSPEPFKGERAHSGGAMESAD